MSPILYKKNPLKDYYMFYKPTGCITAKKDASQTTVMHYLKEDRFFDIHMLGRLDKDTSGLLLLSNDGAFTNFLMSPQNHISKTYEFCVLGNLDCTYIHTIEQGIYFPNDDKITAPCKITITNKTTLNQIFPIISNTKYRNLYHKHPLHPVTFGTILVTEGRKHQVKKLLKYAHCYVVALKRTQIGHLTLDNNLKPGTYRPLKEEDFMLLY